MINPCRLLGMWNEGYVMDSHTITSTYLGCDEYGHDRYHTERTELGQLIYEMKYNGHNDTSGKIIDIISPFLDNWILEINIDLIIAVPPTESRIQQPVFLIADKIACKYNIPFNQNVLVKTSSAASKNMSRYSKQIDGSILLQQEIGNCRNILLIDDLYSTGSTSNECVKMLRENTNAVNIYFLAMTKTK